MEGTITKFCCTSESCSIRARGKIRRTANEFTTIYGGGVGKEELINLHHSTVLAMK